MLILKYQGYRGEPKKKLYQKCPCMHIPYNISLKIVLEKQRKDLR